MWVIPAIDIQEGLCVRLTQGRLGTTTVYSQDPAKMARFWVDQGAERLHVVDLDGAFQGRPKNFAIVEAIVKAIDIPVQVGGGIRSPESIKKYIDCGVDSVILGSKAAEDSHFLKEACRSFPLKIIVGIDAKGGRVMTEGWTQDSGQSAVELAKKSAELGASRVIYTDVERDGMLGGPNFESISTMVGALDIPVIASGGVSRLADIEAFLSLKPKPVEGVIVGKALYTGALSLPDAFKIARSHR